MADLFAKRGNDSSGADKTLSVGRNQLWLLMAEQDMVNFVMVGSKKASVNWEMDVARGVLAALMFCSFLFSDVGEWLWVGI